MVNTLTPGVYINEISAFPNTVVAAATAVPAFIGYTARADYKGKSYFNQAVQISSFNEFLTFFGVLDAHGNPLPNIAQTAPLYTPTSCSKGPGDITLGGTAYFITPDPGSIYYLFNSIQLFYQNGGADCYVVSVGPIGAPTGKTLAAGAALVNPNVALKDLSAGLAVLASTTGPTMIVVPDAALLNLGDYGTLVEDVLAQCEALRDRMAIVDVYNGQSPDPVLYTQDLTAFKNAVGMNFLNYGAAYYPFVVTTISQDADINFVNLGGAKVLTGVLGNAATTDPIKTLLSQIATADTNGNATSLQIENGLRNASADYANLHNLVLTRINTLPPGAAMAGLYTMVDGTQGVGRAPANFSLSGVTDVTLNISDSMQAPINVDAITGKSINVIRPFPGFGVLVWGARTLDGNSQDNRYVNVRRSLIMIETSLKLALRSYVFAPNVPATWSVIQSMSSSFLSGLWAQGILAGSSAPASFKVAVGLGVTMTADDILNGILNVTIQVAISHPAEFIVINISQMQQS